MLNGKNVLITGGTGSFGKKFVQIVLEHYKPERLIIFSRDELKQFEMSQRFNVKKYPCIRYFLGDVRDRDRLTRPPPPRSPIRHISAPARAAKAGL